MKIFHRYLPLFKLLRSDNPTVNNEDREDLWNQIHPCFKLSLYVHYTTPYVNFQRTVRIFKLPVFLNGHYKNLITN